MAVAELSLISPCYLKKWVAVIYRPQSIIVYAYVRDDYGRDDWAFLRSKVVAMPEFCAAWVALDAKGWR